ncbi:MAG: hypothetical protein K2M07_03565 [Muribaculaceae bacterium]|nr:hypothetical protein [Muribaculaceae bacterium]
MKKHIALVFLAVTLIFAGCSNNDLIDRLPEKISDFLEEYFPGQAVSSADFTPEGEYMVRLHNSALLTFDKENNWRSINGYGSTLPQMFLFDQLPPALYQYLQEMETIGGVYGVVRDNRLYRVELLNRSVIYNVEDGSITIPSRMISPGVITE